VTTHIAPRIGISAVAAHVPSWTLANDWFANTIPRKFVQHTGIQRRAIAQVDEVELALAAIRRLECETPLQRSDCAAVIFVSPSFVPRQSARKFLEPVERKRESLRLAARRFTASLGIPRCPVVGLNWFCSGYCRALAVLQHRVLPRIALGPDQFLLVVTASCISRITDYSCKQSAGLFGDLATATLVSRLDSHRYPVHFELLHASAERAAADGIYFDFQLRRNVPVPTEEGGRQFVPQRLVFSLDGMAIADVAPRAMASALSAALNTAGIRPAEVQFVLPHQAGSAIVRLATMKFEQAGVAGEVVNGQTRDVGNVSSGSIPYALCSLWPRLSGTIACPAAAVGEPGRCEVLRGCILLRSTSCHDSLARAA
jgi:3-oxoacyl-[acyl-carrier-protein] synthase III